MEIDKRLIEFQWINDSTVELEGRIRPSYMFDAVIFDGEIISINLYNKEGVLIDTFDEILNSIKLFYNDHIKR
jgi:hypothetical protein